MSAMPNKDIYLYIVIFVVALIIGIGVTSVITILSKVRDRFINNTHSSIKTIIAFIFAISIPAAFIILGFIIPIELIFVYFPYIYIMQYLTWIYIIGFVGGFIFYILFNIKNRKITTINF